MTQPAMREPPIRDAATVVLLRDAADGLEVFMQRRPATMAFAAGATVFPGGAVEEADADPAAPLAGPSRAGVPLAFAVAAIRETFEEAGLLLARPALPGAQVAPDSADPPDPAELAAARSRLLAGEVSLAEAVRGLGLHLAVDSLVPLANWVTPPGRSRRFDTLFLLTRAPEGQDAGAATAESETSEWLSVAELGRRWRAEEIQLMLPTWAQLSFLGSHPTAESALAAAANRPVLRVTGDRPPSADLAGELARYAAREL